MSNSGFDEEDEIDMKMFQSADDKLSSAERLARDQQRAVKDKIKLSGILSRCNRCIDSPRHEKNLTVSVGEYAYVRVKPSMLSQTLCILLIFQ